MQTVEEIQHAIESLSEDDYERIRRWIWETDWDDWDRQMAKDIEVGRFDIFAEQVAEARRQGKLYPPPGCRATLSAPHISGVLGGVSTPS